jgi:hypothetical protein
MLELSEILKTQELTTREQTELTKDENTNSTTWTNEGDGMFTGKKKLSSTRKVIKIVNLR